LKDIKEIAAALLLFQYDLVLLFSSDIELERRGSIFLDLSEASEL
jgi:hypothetical protein